MKARSRSPPGSSPARSRSSASDSTRRSRVSRASSSSGRFSGARTLSATSERRAQQLVALSFFLLAPYVAVEALLALAVEHHAETSWLGIGLALGSLLICPGLGVWKRRIGTQLGSAATRGEGKQNLLCAGLAVGVLAGLLGNTLFGLWWLDPAVALIISGAAIQGGAEAWRGTGCDGCC